MGIRETLNKNPMLAVGMSLGGILAASAMILYMQRPPEPPPPYAVFFTTDEGKTTFAGDISMVPPFEHQGSEAVRVYMYRSPDGGEPFAGFLEKLTPDARQRLAAATNADERSEALEAIGGRGLLVKKPGSGDWVPRSSPQAAQVTSVTDSLGRQAVPVLPTSPPAAPR